MSESKRRCRHDYGTYICRIMIQLPFFCIPELITNCDLNVINLQRSFLESFEVWCKRYGVFWHLWPSIRLRADHRFSMLSIRGWSTLSFSWPWESDELQGLWYQSSVKDFANCSFCIPSSGYGSPKGFRSSVLSSELDIEDLSSLPLSNLALYHKWVIPNQLGISPTLWLRLPRKQDHWKMFEPPTRPKSSPHTRRSSIATSS